jgi:hypothetical protein
MLQVLSGNCAIGSTWLKPPCSVLRPKVPDLDLHTQPQVNWPTVTLALTLTIAAITGGCFFKPYENWSFQIWENGSHMRVPKANIIILSFTVVAVLLACWSYRRGCRAGYNTREVERPATPQIELVGFQQADSSDEEILYNRTTLHGKLAIVVTYGCHYICIINSQKWEF